MNIYGHVHTCVAYRAYTIATVCFIAMLLENGKQQATVLEVQNARCKPLSPSAVAYSSRKERPAAALQLYSFCLLLF